MTEIVLAIIYLGIQLFNIFFVIGVIIGFIWLMWFLVQLVRHDSRMKSESEVE